jgi:hypothetical protein
MKTIIAKPRKRAMSFFATQATLTRRNYRGETPRPRCTIAEIRIMRKMRSNGFCLAEIAFNIDRTAPCVWQHTKDINHRNWTKDRLLQRLRAGGEVQLVHSVKKYMR